MPSVLLDTQELEEILTKGRAPSPVLSRSQPQSVQQQPMTSSDGDHSFQPLASSSNPSFQRYYASVRHSWARRYIRQPDSTPNSSPGTAMDLRSRFSHPVRSIRTKTGKMGSTVPPKRRSMNRGDVRVPVRRSFINRTVRSSPDIRIVYRINW